jgi:hypothetical protein
LKKCLVASRKVGQWNCDVAFCILFLFTQKT